MDPKPLRRDSPAVDEAGKPLANLNQYSEEVVRRLTVVGTGSPEGVASAVAGRQYLAQGDYPAMYVKTVNSVNGDTTKGWVLVSGSHYVSEMRFQDFTTQEPAGVDIPTVVKYGAAATSPNDFVSVTAGGVFQVLKSGPYLLKSNLRISRVGSGGASNIHLWIETSDDGVTFVPLNVSIRATIDNGATDAHLYDSSPAFFPAGLYLRTMQARSSTGHDSGGLYSEAPSATLQAYGVGADPSASLEWHIMTGYNYDE